jgi:hypothetical protein
MVDVLEVFRLRPLDTFRPSLQKLDLAQKLH